MLFRSIVPNIKHLSSHSVKDCVLTKTERYSPRIIIPLIHTGLLFGQNIKRLDYYIIISKWPTELHIT